MPRFAQNCPKCPDVPKMSRSAQNCPELPKMPKIAQNCPKCPELPRMPRIAQNAQKYPKCPELPKMPRIAQIAVLLKNSERIFFLGCTVLKMMMISNQNSCNTPWPTISYTTILVDWKSSDNLGWVKIKRQSWLSENQVKIGEACIKYSLCWRWSKFNQCFWNTSLWGTHT